MKLLIRYLPLVPVTLLLATLAAEAQAGGVLYFKTGNVRLWDENQFLDNVNRDFEEGSSRTFGMGFENRRRRGVALGVEYLNYRHEYTPSNSPTIKGQAKTQILNFTARKYFNASRVFVPFVGLGFGPGHTSVSGGADVDPEVELTIQLNTGFELRFDNFGIFTEIKGLYMDVEAQRVPQYDPSGTGLFVGVSFIF